MIGQLKFSSRLFCCSPSTLVIVCVSSFSRCQLFFFFQNIFPTWLRNINRFSLLNILFAGPLDRNCSKLIFPACKTLGIYNYTLVSEQHQKTMYTYAYLKEYKEGELETSFPPRIQKMLDKYPRCQENIKKLYCGEYMPPCFADEFAANGHGYYTICQSVCDQIKNDCPGFFRSVNPRVLAWYPLHTQRRISWEE